IWNLLQRAADRVVAAVPAQPSGYRPEMPDLSYKNNMKSWGPELCARRPDITMAMVETFLTNMYRGARADFVYTVTRAFVRTCQTPILVLPDDVPGHPYAVAPAGRRAGAPIRRRDGDRTSRAERAGEPEPVEGHAGQDPTGGAPHPHLPPGASTGDGRPLSPLGWRRSTALPCPSCGSRQHNKRVRRRGRLHPRARRVGASSPLPGEEEGACTPRKRPCAWPLLT